MKFNWGTGIGLFYSVFMFTMIYMVYRSTQYDRNLVVENYYEEDLQYQSHLDKLNNTAALGTDLKIAQKKESDNIAFVFPKNFQTIEGDILFYRASDHSKDIKVKIELDENNELFFPTKVLQKGAWKVKVNWKGDNVPYYKEKNIHI